MGIDQLGFQSVQLGYLKILQMGPSAITPQWFSDTTDQLVTTPMIAFYLSCTTHLSTDHNVALSQISPGHGNLSLLKRATSLVMPNTAGTSLELNSKSSRTLGSSFAKTFDQHCYFAFLSSVDSGHLTGINRKSYSRRDQRHQSRPKQRRKSTAIYRRRVRMNSNYRGFTGENDEKYRVQNILSVEQHLCYVRYLVKADLGESVKLHPQKVLTGKSMATYIKNNLKVTPGGESSKQTEDTTNNTEGGESQISQQVGQETRVIEKENAASKKKKGEIAEADKKKKKLVNKTMPSQTVEAGSKDAPADSSSQPSSDLDSRPRDGQKRRGGTKRK
ncbi:hypothetical protein F511_43019 [Dorcoceras hygrometricum]|uniref:Uncharacterized protein n=1 Tax=Dorcoceras hygrometricum TaxID=472368 RepID=A0A2Z7BM37_9LAMI|nr:hypothetical protein F511_43019 [Dorcoceras hygrometricum]